MLHVLIHCVKSVQNEDYLYLDVETNAFINYLKNPSLYIKSGKLCVTDKNINIVGRSQLVSMKDLFTTIIDRNEWNNTQQQDSSEALLLMLDSLMERGRDGPYNFCQYENNVWVTCPRCNIPLIDQTTYENFLLINLRQNTIDSMRQALEDTVNGNFNGDRHCGICGLPGTYETLEFLQTNQFFHIVITSDFGECVPLQEFKLRLAGGIVKKYELQCYIERYGIDNNTGHFWVNIKRNNNWHKANDI